MAHYTCGDCGAVSDEVKTPAEARQLLGTHQTYFCRPLPRTAPTSTPVVTPAGQGGAR
ncbi:hypothetical protein FraEuI1c_5818 [Pseudofrankia inefficax]|uniref:Uncharacterized protein n=1 Tax=Pseudofrankia inefficax (strain DSM 45817 / CECT 9037 / DDB 130130 / EuI1c) TaxID=298654 RepID=E3IX30_PSEI1|nr:hypothetical protein FraEuI1c_5818 [Pseudofrankia inefficax]